MKKKIILLSVLIIIFILLIGSYFFLNSKKLVLEYDEKVTVELNNEIYNIDNIKKVTNGSIETKKEKIDTSKPGEKRITFIIKDFYGKKKKYTYTIVVVDKEAPVITYNKNLTTIEGTKIDLLSNVSATDNSNETIEVKVEGQYDFNKAGTYKINYVAQDSSNNKTSEEAILKVEKKVVVNNVVVNNGTANYTGTTSKGFKIEVKNGVTYIDGTLIANKTYSLPKNYGNGITKEAQSAFNSMKSAAAKDGISLKIISGFRSYNTQVNLYNNYVKRDGKAAADTYSARPGHSEHQSGLGMDINQISDTFGSTPAGKWLNNNSYKYGFILRYPKGKTNETGYMYESWHFRYVGVELATKLYNNGNWITLESYYGITSKY